jgi:hypothetical protein
MERRHSLSRFERAARQSHRQRTPTLEFGVSTGMAQGCRQSFTTDTAGENDGRHGQEHSGWNHAQK